MSAIFDTRKLSALAAECDPAIDTGQAAVSLLSQWLATHESQLGARAVPVPTEFNGTLMQWFH
jgi:alpha-amylase